MTNSVSTPNSNSALKRLIVLAAVLATGCASSQYSRGGYYPDTRYGYGNDYGYPSAPIRPRRSGADQSADTAERVCSIDSLTQARNEWRSEIRDAGTGYGRTGEIRVETEERVEARPYGPQTATLEMIRAFETDLDAAYRFATSSCQAYSVCMDQQRYDEYACQGSAQRWSEAQARFEAMSGRLGEIRLEIAENCADCRGYRSYQDHRRYRGRHDGYPRRGRHYRRDRDAYCDGVLGDVFTTGECRDRRTRRRHY